VAIIQNGTRPNQRIALGTIATICQVVREQKMASPAIIVVGKVVDLHF
jgi:uroporphyrin-III C-methyltransferase